MQRKRTKTENCIGILLVFLSIVAAVIKIKTGFDIDEGYAVTMPYRLLQGEHLFQDLWEVHQTSSFLPALFLALYIKITGVTDGVAIYLRIVATIFHAAVSLAVWKSSRKELPAKWSLLLALLYFNMLPKWLISLDFSMQQIWGVTLVLLLLKKEMETEKCGYDVLMGLALAMTVLAYPGMLVLYPCLLVIVCILNRDKEIKTRFNKCAAITLACFLMAVLFFAYILMHMRLSELIDSIPMVFMDGTHQFTMRTKLLAYAMQWLNVGKQLLIFTVPSLIITVVIYHVKKTGKKSFLWIFTAVQLAVTSLLVITANLFGISMGPFHFQVRYLLLFICVWVLAYRNRKGNSWLFWGPVMLTSAAFAGILLFSNVGPDASSSYLVTGLLAAIALFAGYEHRVEQSGEKRRSSSLLWLTSALFVLSLIFCKGYYVRITEYGPSTILQQRVQMQKGPLKGIYLLLEDYERMTSDYETIHRVTQGEESLLFLGTEGIENLAASCRFVSPSTISTPAFNEQWVEYFEAYPQKQPSLIVIAKNTVDDRDKFFAKNPFGIWIRERYDTYNMEETPSLCIIRRK